MGSHGPMMDVKVLYTVESSPHHTMLARLGRPVPVEVIIPNTTPPSPLNSDDYYESPRPSRVRFGRIALKTCLGAVCMASPELLPDDKRDYIIYAVDPEETFRVNQLRSPSGARGMSGSTRSPSSSSRDRSDPGPSKLSSSPARPKDSSPTSILVGKGFFNWALDEEGEGETTITGRVRSDGRRLRYENGREYEEDIHVLEVVIKLKESQSRSKDKYFNLVRGLSSSTANPTPASRPPSRSSIASVSFSASSRSRPHRQHPGERRSTEDITLRSEPDYPASAYNGNDGHITRAPGRVPQLKRPATDMHEEAPRKRPSSESTTPVPPAELAPTPEPKASTPKSSMPRTLSEACQREAEKLESQRSNKKRVQQQPKKLADREYVLDEVTGKYRSRRSMRENPAGKKPGRPKGSCKVNPNAVKTKRQAGESSQSNSPAIVQSQGPAHDEASPAVQQRNEREVPQSKQTSQNQDLIQNEFRAPLPPQARMPLNNNTKTVNFAQSSPVRPSMNAMSMQPDLSTAPYPGQGYKSFDSPSRDVRFRVPSYLMNSSPGTMLDTLMSEADFDFQGFPISALQTPGTLFGNMDIHGQRNPTPLRRSPRKNPLGTVSGQNPYASPNAQCPPSPTLGRMASSHRGHGSSKEGPVLSSSDSPVTRSRTRSGQDALHPALYSSSDGVTGQGTKNSSNATSPASPSTEASVSKKGKPANGAKKRGAVSKAGSSNQKQSKTQVVSRTAKVDAAAAARKAATDRSSRAVSIGSNGGDVEDEGDNEPEATFVKGPYRTTNGGTSSREGSVGLPSCPPSPSVSRATRILARTMSTASPHSVSNKGLPDARAKLASLDLPPSSPVFDHPTTESHAIEVDGWGRTPSMREIFPTPSDLEWPSDESPAESTGNTEAKKEVPPTSTEVPAIASASIKAPHAASAELVRQPQLQVPARRKPLPATVEDASSSVSGSSPAPTEESPDASNANLFDLLEDPYGILAASGFGIDANGGLTSLEITVPQAAMSGELTPTASGTANQPAISADAFNEVQLHQAKEFGSHLSEFGQNGGTGVAAHVAGSGSAAAVQVGPGAITAVKSNDTTSHSIISTLSNSSINGFDTSFLSNLPPELSSIFTSPKKQLPPQIVEILTSPRKNKTKSREGSSSISSPSANTMNMIQNTHGFDAPEGMEADFSALFNNPDIQAMLAEFGTSG